MSQRNRLFLLLFAVTAPLVALAAVFVVSSAQEARDSAERDSLAIARAGALATESFFDGHVRTLRAIAVNVRDAPSLSEPALRQRLLTASEANPQWSGMSVVRANGIVIAGSRETSKGADLSARPYLKELFATGQPVVSDGIVTVIEGIPAVLIATPVDFSDGSKGALIGSVTLETLSSALTKSLTTTSRVGLVDRAGQRLVHSESNSGAAALNVADRPEIIAAAAGETSTMQVERNGVPVLVAYTPVARLHWVVTVAEDVATAYGEANALARRGAILISLAVAAVALGGLFLGRRLNHSYEAVQNARQAEQIARERAEAALRSRDEFLSIASHELRNPVAVIRGFGQLLQRRLDRGLLGDADLREYVDDIAASGAHLSRLVEDLLSVSRLEGGRLELLMEEADVLQILRHAVADAPVMEHSLSLIAPDGPLLMQIDSDRVTQIFANLLENAAKYSPVGTEIVVAVSVEAERVRIDVTDQGIGLPPEDVERLFVPFARASNARQANIPGLGLGLYVSHQLAEAHGGSLVASSAGEGHGSTFTLTLPLAALPAGGDEDLAVEERAAVPVAALGEGAGA